MVFLDNFLSITAVLRKISDFLASTPNNDNMSTLKRNEWLDGGESEEELGDAYDSDAQEESRGALAGRSIKRRKVDEDEDDVSEDDLEEDIIEETGANDTTDGDQSQDARFSQLDEGDLDTATKPLASKTQTVKPLTVKQLAASQKATQKTGVIYLSRIPPFMKPATLKHFLDGYGDIGRIFLSPEDPTSHARRVRSGGNKKKSFTDGWVEFKSKKDAKIVAETLNGNIVGGKKGNFYHDDVWNIKYLKGFKWHHLTDQIANENAERAARLRAEISRTRKENKDFVADIERSKMLEGMRAKKAKKAADGNSVDGGELANVRAEMKEPGRRDGTRTFKQNTAKVKTGNEAKAADQPESTQRVLRKLF